MASFDAYIPLLIAAEGGYQNLVSDSGNYNSRGELVGTNHGISAPVYENWIARVPTEADMRAMSKTVALEIMKSWYWNKLSASFIENQSIANIIVDHGVNAGTGAIGTMVQKILNNSFGYNLIIDGSIGNKTIEAINSVNAQILHEAIKTARHNFYLKIGGEFLSVWLNRLSTFVFTEKKKP